MLMETEQKSGARPIMEQRRLQLYLLLFVTDMAALLAAFVLAGGIYRGVWPMPFALNMAYAFIPVFAAIAFYQRCYSLRALDDFRYSITRLGAALAISAILCMVMIFYAKAAQAFSRVMLSLALIFGFAMMAMTRAALHKLLRRVYGESVVSTLVILDGGPPVNAKRTVTINTGTMNIEGARSDPSSLDEIGRVIRGMDRVIVSCTADRRAYWAEILRAAGVRGEVISEVIQELGAISLNREDGQSFLVVSTGPLSLRSRLLKRAFDVVVCTAALVLLSPVMIITAILIKLEDGGPVLFVQPRMGRGNCIFRMFKFRSMRIDGLDHDGARSTSRSDDRVTRIGRFIRKTSIDELPQLFNVLRNEMSIVGPRPHALGSLAEKKLFWEVDDKYWQRHSLKPGLTGLAQVRGHRGATESESHLKSRLNADLEYIGNWSLVTDIKIVLATARVMLHENAF